MRNTRYTLFLLVAALAIGIGCFRNPTPEEPVPAPQPTTEDVSNLLGVISAMDATGVSLQMDLADGSSEHVVLSDGSGLPPGDDIGLLIRISGVRDLATREITASVFEVLSSPGLFVVSPMPGSAVASPMLVQGFGRTFEQVFSWRIKNSGGDVVLEGYNLTHAADIGQYSSFGYEVFLPAMNELPFTLEVYEISAEDGSETNLVSVPLHQLTTEKTQFDVFFSRDKSNQTGECEAVFPVHRTIAQTSAVGRAALLELLRGPTEQEVRAGYRTNIPADVALNSLIINSGTAIADFSQELNAVAGSCRVAAVTSQIVNTLHQFAGVSDVVISVGGDTSTALQP
jgi:hypothetical protein